MTVTKVTIRSIIEIGLKLSLHPEMFPPITALLPFTGTHLLSKLTHPFGTAKFRRIKLWI